MDLSVPVDLKPMEARTAEEVPAGGDWAYEPKWDGFRCLAFRDGDALDLRSKSGKPLLRYFPDVGHSLLALRARRFVLDGELVVPTGDRLSFESLLLRIHPAGSRVARLAAGSPALFIAFDLLLSWRGGALTAREFAVRRQRLEELADRFFDGPMRLSPQTRDVRLAGHWLSGGEDGLDGVMAKRLDMPYRAGERSAMVKVKRLRTADCVIGGFRYASGGRGVGSLLLGLHDEEGLLHHVGFTSSFDARRRAGLARQLQEIAGSGGFSGREPGGPSRWSTRRTNDWVPVEPRLVAEVRYDHFCEGRFRHGTRFERWRPDKDPADCTFHQLETEGRSTLHLLERHHQHN
ncbi:MAG TPA: ATP-dependent DNA ligase [Longimicrobiales bacterium]|nr:ATP-dependent DNA ligase [Longimicrobiales bacterium]